MAKKKSKSAPAPDSKSQAVAKIGMGALIFGALTWLTGPLTRENGLEWVRSLFIAVALALVIRWALVEPFKIPSSSMEPTLNGDPRLLRGDRVFVNKWVYGLRYPLNHFRIPRTTKRIEYADKRIWRGAEPQRWDVVVFKSVEKGGMHDTLIKRVVGLPGERVHIANGRVYIDGKPLELPPSMPDVYYTSPDWRMSTDMKYGILDDERYSVVPEGHYFLLGDNSKASKDGRFWGWVPNEHIIGRTFAIWWPPNRWGDFTGFSRTWWWKTIVAVGALLTLWRMFFGRSWRAHNDAVKDTVAGGEHVFVNRFAFGMPVPFTTLRLTRGRTPKRGELVLYHTPEGAEAVAHMLLGRVAGLPGEQVYLDGGNLLIDGAPVQAPASLAQRNFASDEKTGTYARSKSKSQSLVPADHYFLLVDDPNESPDSRLLGWIPRKDLVGPITRVWWPLGRWRRITW